ncbi:MAG: hypothetical protein CMH90_05410 [Oceanicaulis sp.]|uniref:CC0125/CC1285 family lipoprotein n=1 Tax=Oceanicaulis sp. UBA2681 TaxID=1947007 RepID=UPI000C0A6CCB|nr:hypothetical protein [Oceanicaulis sp. UBA2681]MAP48902.1 hypothetical protein [Oceanicaulis sp.]HCR66484.1 hypothetical protein [Oceanicaulis sp.]|tara:strand:+ start:614 stop:1129 length:516 start_codon:yes stop_codon:yes gene_type:complete
MRALWLTGPLALVALTGCAVTSDAFVSPPLSAYGPASASVDGLGYDALRTGPDTWRVWYTAPARTDDAQVEQFALRHAAETVHNAGYDWFRIRYDATPRHADGYRPVSRSGDITPAYVDEVERAGPMGLVRNWIFREGPQGQITAILDVQGGRGARPGGAHDPVVIIGSYP